MVYADVTENTPQPSHTMLKISFLWAQEPFGISSKVWKKLKKHSNTFFFFSLLFLDSAPASLMLWEQEGEINTVWLITARFWLFWLQSLWSEAGHEGNGVDAFAKSTRKREPGL